MAGPRRRLDPDASSHQDRKRRRIEGTDGRSPARKRRDDKSIRKVRLQPRPTPRSPDTPSGTKARLETTFSAARPHAFGVEMSRKIWRLVLPPAPRFGPTSVPRASADSRYPG